MKKQLLGWTIVGISILWGILRATDLAEPNFVLNFLAIGGFCFGIYLTTGQNAEEEWLIFKRIMIDFYIYSVV